MRQRPEEEFEDIPATQPFRHGDESEAGDYQPHSLGKAAACIVEVAGAAFKIGSSCDSPIEAMLGGEIIVEFERRGKPLKVCTTIDVDNLQDGLLLVPQYRWGIYRSDWAILRPATASQALLIECDGQAFHSSPEQRAHDQKKDAAARDRGHLTVRFSGREINRNSQICAQAVYMLVLGDAS